MTASQRIREARKSLDIGWPATMQLDEAREVLHKIALAPTWRYTAEDSDAARTAVVAIDAILNRS